MEYRRGDGMCDEHHRFFVKLPAMPETFPSWRRMTTQTPDLVPLSSPPPPPFLLPTTRPRRNAHPGCTPRRIQVLRPRPHFTASDK